MINAAIPAPDQRRSPRRFMNWGEPECLVALSSQARVCVEFGVNDGLTAQHLLTEHARITDYVGVDVLPGYTPSCKVQTKEVPLDPGHYARYDPRFRLILKRRGTLDLTDEELPMADFVSIDGDHGYEAVMHDSYLAMELVRKGGVIVWHDYHDKGTVGVADALHELQSRGWPLTHVEGTGLVFMQVGR